MTSCNWSDRCFFDFNSNWFQPRPPAVPSYLADQHLLSAAAAASSSLDNLTTTANATVLVAKDLINTTANALVGAAADQAAQARAEWTGIGMEWLRSLLGKREWRIDCLDVYIRL